MTRRLAPILFAAACAAAAAGCGRSAAPAQPVADREYEQRLTAAQAAYEQGHDEQAAALYQRVADRAYVRDDLPDAAQAQFSRAVCLARLGRYEEAMDALDRADHARGLAGLPVAADHLLVRARVAWQQEDAAQATALAQRVIDAPDAEADWIAEARGLIGLAAADEGDAAAATRALAAMGESRSVHVQAEHARLAGRIAMLEGRFADAAEDFDHEVDLRRRSHAYGTMAAALAASGAAYAKLDQPDEAAGRYLRAGRSAARQSMPDDAGRWLDRAAALADAAGDAETARLARAEREALSP